MESVIKNQRKLVLLMEENDRLKCTIANSGTQMVSSVTTLNGNKMKNFVEDIPNMFKKEAKAVFLCIPEYCPPVFSSCYEFRKKLKQKFDNLKIPYYFFNKFQWYFSGMLISVNYVSKIDDFVVFIEALEDGVAVVASKFTKNGYLHTRENGIIINAAGSNEDIREDILQQVNPAAIFIRGTSSIVQRLKEIFKSNKVFIFEEKWNPTEPRILNEKLKWFFDRSNVKFHVCPVSFEKVTLSAKVGDADYPLITFDEHMLLPLSTTKTFKKIVNICSVSILPQKAKHASKKYKSCSADNEIWIYIDKDENISIIDKPVAEESITEKPLNNTPKVLASWLPDQEVHQHEATLSIDDQGFINYSIKALIWREIKHLPQVFNDKYMVPVIIFVENLSFICVRKNAKSGYKYLDSWNGEYGLDLYISFDEEKPKYGQDAVKVEKTKPSYVVHNVFTMLITPPEDIKKFPKEAFQITEDEKNPILVEFDNFDGTRKAATPEFLMALLLKQHLKAIKKEIGEKPKKIIVTSFVDFKEEELNRFKSKVTEACEMLKISCEFIDFKELV